MIPLRDNLTPTKTALVNYFLITANLVVFLIELAVPDLETFIRAWGLVPAALDFANLSTLLRFVSSMFLHAGWIHIGSNMLFLHVFGDMVESRLGHLRFLFWYLSWGVAAAISQYILTPHSTLPILGASGAVAGVMGAYFVFFKHSTIRTLLPTFWGFMTVVEVPASLMLLYWFVIQLFSGSASIVSGGAALGGVAWFAHVGGFLAGWLTARRLKESDSEEPIGVDW